MDQREQRVKVAQSFFLEYLKLMNHYGMLEKDQKDHWKALARQAEGGGEESSGQELVSK